MQNNEGIVIEISIPQIEPKYQKMMDEICLKDILKDYVQIF